MRSRRVIVTGGAGFIGSHVVERLVGAGASVVVIDDLSSGLETNIPAGVPLVRVDLASPDAVAAIAEVRPEWVIHCAAQSSVPISFEDPIRDAHSNIIGSLSLIQGCRPARVARFVYVTTGGALHSRPMERPWDERAQVSPSSPYGISKSIVEAYLEVLPPAPRVAVLRLANVYGPRQGEAGEAGVVAIFVQRMLAGLPVVIHGDGQQTRDMLFVGDAVDAMEAVLEGDHSGTFNVGTGTGTAVKEIFRTLAALIGYEQVPERADGRPGDIRHSVLDSALARDRLGWQAHTSLADGLAKTVGAALRDART